MEIICSLFSLFNETLQTLPSIRGGCLASQTQSNSRKNCTFTTAIFADNEIDKRSKFDGEVFMAHKIIAIHALNNAMICWYIWFITIGGIFFLNYLSCVQLQLVFIIELQPDRLPSLIDAQILTLLSIL